MKNDKKVNNIYKTVLDETFKCNELMKKIESVVHEICNCDDSTVHTNYENLVKQKLSCDFCRHNMMSNFLLDNHIVCYNFLIENDELMEKLIRLELNKKLYN